MKFRTAFERGETTYTERGSEILPTYEYRIDKKTGKRKTVQVGETNIYEKIQASLESTKLENIVKRCTNGDLSVLSVRDGSYIDITEIPTNMMDLQNLILKTKQEFDKLPAEIRAKFDYSAEKYVSDYGKENWKEALGITKANEKQSNELKETKNINEQKGVTTNE